MTEKVYEDYLRFGRIAADAEPYSAEYHEALDQLQSLPGWPVEGSLGPDEILQPIVVDNVQSVVH